MDSKTMLRFLVQDSSHNILGFEFLNLGLPESCASVSEFLTFLHPSYITRKTAF